MSAPALTVVVPMFNAPEKLERCLAALFASTAEHELIVVDDCSTDQGAVELARRLLEGRGTYLCLERNSGPGVARNRGVEAASGELIAFIDSDCLVTPTTLEQMRDAFVRDPGIGALFGSYDDSPDSPGTVTEYRNLLHHWTHQTGPREATTFWSGCGAIRRELFLRLGGFDAARYDKPAIEDIELGMRIKEAGERVLLCPDIQVKHLKHWSLWEMVKVDVTCRAIPWTRLLIERPGTGGDLNLESNQKLCVAAVFLALGSLLGGLLLPWLRVQGLWWWAPLACLVPVLWINRSFYLLCLRHKGPAFALASVLLHLLYYFYGGLSFLYAHVTHRLGIGRTPAPVGS